MNPAICSIAAKLNDDEADALLVQLAGNAMRDKLAKKRRDGRGGWHRPETNASILGPMLEEHVGKGDMIDVMNIAGMIYMRQQLYGEMGLPAQPKIVIQTGSTDLADCDDDRRHTTFSPAKRYVALNADGVEVSCDSRDFAVLVDHQAGLIFDLRGIHRGSWNSCTDFARDSKLLGRSWRLGTVEEIFINVASRAHFNPAVNRDLFPMLKREWVWTSTPDVDDDPASPVSAWGVYLRLGSAYVTSAATEALRFPFRCWACRPVSHRA